jgi:hypothetical protein
MLPLNLSEWLPSGAPSGTRMRNVPDANMCKMQVRHARNMRDLRRGMAVDACGTDASVRIRAGVQLRVLAGGITNHLTIY